MHLHGVAQAGDHRDGLLANVIAGCVHDASPRDDEAARPDQFGGDRHGGTGGFPMALADLESVVRAGPSRRDRGLQYDAPYGAEIHQHGVHGVTHQPMTIPGADLVGGAPDDGPQP